MLKDGSEQLCKRGLGAGCWSRSRWQRALHRANSAGLCANTLSSPGLGPCTQRWVPPAGGGGSKTGSPGSPCQEKRFFPPARRKLGEGVLVHKPLQIANQPPIC